MDMQEKELANRVRAFWLYISLPPSAEKHYKDAIRPSGSLQFFRRLIVWKQDMEYKLQFTSVYDCLEGASRIATDLDLHE